MAGFLFASAEWHGHFLISGPRIQAVRPPALRTVKRCSLDTCTHERLAGGGKANIIVYYHYDDEEGRRSSTS